MSVVSGRMRAADTAFAAVKDFYLSSRYSERRLEPGICDFTFGNPHEMPLPGIVAALRQRALPGDENWFAYKTSEPDPQAYLAQRVGEELGLAFEPADIALTTGAFAAIMVAFRLLLDAGDEAVFSEPAWFCYEPMLLAADAVPRKVALKALTTPHEPGLGGHMRPLRIEAEPGTLFHAVHPASAHEEQLLFRFGFPVCVCAPFNLQFHSLSRIHVGT